MIRLLEYWMLRRSERLTEFFESHKTGELDCADRPLFGGMSERDIRWCENENRNLEFIHNVISEWKRFVAWLFS